MLYSQARPKIKSGDVLAWRGAGIISRVIRRVTMSSHSHVGIAWVANGRVFILEAVEGYGIGLRPLSQACPFYWVPIRPHMWNNDAAEFAFSKLQEGYSYTDALLAGFGFRMNSDQWICSEYAREILRLMGLPVPDDAQTPAQLMDYLHRNNYHMQYVRHDDAPA